jgi:hypothetical protein
LLLASLEAKGKFVTLQIEQCLLPAKSTAVPDETAVGAYDAMAGHDNRNRILPVCRSNGSCFSERAHPLGELTIRDRFAVRDIEQRLPDPA